MGNVYEVIVERRIRNRFMVEARSGSEAAMRVGANLAGETPFTGSDEQETDRRILTPKTVPGAGPQQVIDFYDSLRKGETPPEPTGTDGTSTM